MNTDAIFKETIVVIATSAAIIRFAIVECEGVVATWRRLTGARKGRMANRAGGAK
jgi:hypothetical protein